MKIYNLRKSCKKNKDKKLKKEIGIGIDSQADNLVVTVIVNLSIEYQTD